MHSDYVSRHSLHKVGVGGLCLHNDSILFVKHTYGISKGKWTLPGGYVELGETLSNAIEREVFEETGVQTIANKILTIRHMNSEKKDKGLISDLYIVFKLKYESGEPLVESSEISEVKFLPVDSLDDFPISELSSYIVGKILKNTGFSLLPYQPNLDIKDNLNVKNYQLYG